MKKDSIQKRTYERVSLPRRQALLNLVFQQGMKIKHAAKSLKIKYAAAKTIIIQHRMSNILQRVDNKSMRRCNFKENDYKNRTLTIISKIAGDTIKEGEYAITPAKKP